MNVDNLHAIRGPALLLAGPGTGKTFRLGQRIKYLVEECDIAPNTITVITFTVAAAKNMRERISDATRAELFIPYSKQPRLICTMHSLGHRIITESSKSIGLKGNVRVVADDSLRLVLMGDASQLKGYERADGGETAACRQSGDCNPKDERKCSICNTYRLMLRSCSSVDYDEQILLACQVLKDNPDLLMKYRSYAKHLLVDEYQDINAAQFELITLLSEGQRDGLFVVGDDDQSIYSWRGGSPKFIRDFKKAFGDEATVEQLQKSYRCHKRILESALAVVTRFDKKRLPKSEFEYKVEDGPRIRIHNVPSDEKEAQEVRRIIEAALPSQDVLVLFPQRQYSHAIVAELRRHQIPFSAPVSMPGTGLPLIATMAEWLSDTGDTLALRRCIESYLSGHPDVVPSARVRKPEKKAEREAVYARISRLWETVLSGESESLWNALEKNKDGDPVLESVHASLAQLIELYYTGKDINGFLAAVADGIVPWRDVSSFLEETVTWVDYGLQMRSMGSSTDVKLMTLQGAKGLEAHVVCVIGTEEGSLPRSESEDEVIEQSRLFFVSMTRAINELHLFHARTRSGGVVHRDIYASGGKPDLAPSRYLNAIPKTHREDIFHPA